MTQNRSHVYRTIFNVKIPTPKVVVCGIGRHTTTFGVGERFVWSFYKHATTYGVG